MLKHSRGRHYIVPEALLRAAGGVGEPDAAPVEGHRDVVGAVERQPLPVVEQPLRPPRQHIQRVQRAPRGVASLQRKVAAPKSVVRKLFVPLHSQLQPAHA